jgi:hypothetical protein
VVVVAAMDAVAEEARGDQECEKQSNGGLSGDGLHYSELLPADELPGGELLLDERLLIYRRR